MITDNNEKTNLKQVEDLIRWCQDNSLLLKVSKTKELIVDFGKKQGRNYCGALPCPKENVNQLFIYYG